jgi:hypothetical protein
MKLLCVILELTFLNCQLSKAKGLTTKLAMCFQFCIVLIAKSNDRRIPLLTVMWMTLCCSSVINTQIAGNVMSTTGFRGFDITVKDQV